MRRRARTDGNHREIVAALRALGCSVADTSRLGDGFPDLVVAMNKKSTVLVEIKDGAKPPSARQLTEAEREFRDAWKGCYRVVESVDDALDLARELALGMG
jgi:Holliday junction resolvase